MWVPLFHLVRNGTIDLVGTTNLVFYGTNTNQGPVFWSILVRIGPRDLESGVCVPLFHLVGHGTSGFVEIDNLVY